MCFVIEANAPIGPGDRFVADPVAEVATPVVLVVNKVDRASRDADRRAPRAGVGRARRASRRSCRSRRAPATASTRCSASSRRGCPRARTTTPTASSAISPSRSSRPSCCASSCSRSTHDELPHSIAVTTEEIEERETKDGPLLALRLVVRVERDSQKGIVIGRGGAVLRQAGTAARLELEALLGVRVHLETHVKVDRDWQRRADVARPPRALNRRAPNAPVIRESRLRARATAAES